jgi:sulfotransferase
MTRRFHFISGLPRAGSTLLAALLRQNPRFQASMSSPLGALVSANLQLMSPGSEAALLMEEAHKPRLLRGLFDAYYGNSPAEVAFDTNRQWCARLPLLSALFPEAKVIACVRDVPWIMDSLERIIRAHPFQHSRLFASEADRATVYSRVEALARADRLVGLPWAALKEAFYGEQAASLLVVEYDLLAQAPHKVLPLIYEFLEEPVYDGHDFDHVEFDAADFDAALGLSGLHRVRPKVELVPRRTILPPDLFRKFQGMDFWRDLTASKASVIAARRTPGAEAAPRTEATAA